MKTQDAMPHPAAAADTAGKKRSAPSGIPGDLFPFADFARASSELAAALEAGPFYGLLVGLSGTGKTFLLRHLASRLDRHRFHTLYIAQKNLSPSALGRLLAQSLHVSPRRTHAETLRALAQVIRESPQQLVLLVDEAQRLGIDTIDELRLLAESELDRGPLFAAILAGWPDLRQQLEAPDLAALRRRISLKLELTGLTADECHPFLVRRLGEPLASRLAPDAVPLLFERGRGIPGLIERYADVVLRHTKDGAKVSREAAAEAIETWEEL